jgi:hypothetical protein
MPKYTIHSTKEDYDKVYEEIKTFEPLLGYDLDWKKIKKQNLDNLSFLISALKREVKHKKIL